MADLIWRVKHEQIPTPLRRGRPQREAPGSAGAGRGRPGGHQPLRWEPVRRAARGQLPQPHAAQRQNDR
jgi:hypothetical protein